MATAKPTPVPKKEQDAFFRDLGKLIFWFSFAENGIYLMAHQLLGGPKVAQPVLANLHLERTIELVRELAGRKFQKSEHHLAFDKALLEFKGCASERNQLLHSVAYPADDSSAGKEIISFLSARSMKRAVRERNHVSALEDRVRAVMVRVFSAALEMGMFQTTTTTKKKKEATTSTT